MQRMSIKQSKFKSGLKKFYNTTSAENPVELLNFASVFNFPPMNKIFRISFLMGLLIGSLPVFSNNPVDKFIHDPLMQHANVSILVKDLRTGKELYQQRANSATIPASTLKVLTTATALELMGADYQYKTLLAHDGNIDDSGVLNGNLYIIGSGDPTLGSSRIGDKQFLIRWVDAIKAAGITKINGSIVADESRFDNEGSNPKWTWDDIGNYYAPGIYAIAYRDNTLNVTFKSGAVGTTPEIININPEIKDLTIENNLVSSRITFDSAYFYGTSKSKSRSVRGEIPANSPGFVVKAELPEPGLVLAQDLQSQLEQQGVKITNLPFTIPSSEFTFPAKNAVRTPIYTHHSEPLSHIIREINQQSNNFYAEQVFKSLSLYRYGLGTNRHSVKIIRDFWKSKGLDVNQLFQLDGSGLSPTNAVSAGFLTEVMEYMYKKSTNKDVFFNSLSIAGKVGTLAGVLKKTPLSGKVYAKSGTISRVRSYTGYILQDNREWVFTIMVNNYNGNSWQALRKIEDLLVELCNQ